jgi:hypothetical protein
MLQSIMGAHENVLCVIGLIEKFGLTKLPQIASSRIA